ncbi:MAG: 1-acyl-sn-glycerol-3-phosphate acyltransferase [Thermoguttaceae bacterium]|nr:1-acyl-sn-glycerol-3-phosphate acyltransferase [Thermoguttaceae bacterium]
MKRTFIDQIVYYFSRRTALLFFYIFLRGKFYNWRKVPEEGRLIIVSNHQSYLDPPLVGGGPRRQVGFMAKESLFRGFIGWFFRALNAFPVDREKPVGGIKEALRRLKNEECVALFPEGSRSPDGELHDFMPGLILLAQKTKSPIVPAAIEGAFDAMPRHEHGKMHLFRKVAVLYSDPIPVETVMSLSPDELLKLVRQRITENLNELRKLPAFRNIKKQIEITKEAETSQGSDEHAQQDPQQMTENHNEPQKEPECSNTENQDKA